MSASQSRSGASAVNSRSPRSGAIITPQSICAATFSDRLPQPGFVAERRTALEGEDFGRQRTETTSPNLPPLRPAPPKPTIPSTPTAKGPTDLLLISEGTFTFTAQDSQLQVGVHRYGPSLDGIETLVKFTSLGHSPKKTANILMRAARHYREDDPLETGFDIPPDSKVVIEIEGVHLELRSRFIDNGWIYCVAQWRAGTLIADLAGAMERHDQVATCFASDATTFAGMVGASVAFEMGVNSIDVVHGIVEYRPSEERSRELAKERLWLDTMKEKIEEDKWRSRFMSWLLKATFTKQCRYRNEREYRFWIPGPNSPDELLVPVRFPEGAEHEHPFGEVFCGKTGDSIGGHAGASDWPLEKRP